MSPGPNGAGYETHRVPSYDLDTPSDALENQIGPSVWPLRCFEIIPVAKRHHMVSGTLAPLYTVFWLKLGCSGAVGDKVL